MTVFDIGKREEEQRIWMINLFFNLFVVNRGVVKMLYLHPRFRNTCI